MATALLAVPLAPTSAAFQAEATSSAMVSVRSACVGRIEAYTSSLLPADPALRWSFSGELPLTEADLHPADASAPGLTPTATGLLQCDPADLSPAADVAGSFTLTSGATGSGLTATTPTTLGGAATLLFWAATTPGHPGELASLSAGPDDVLSVALAPDGSVQVAAPASVPGDPEVLVTSPFPADGAAHLVAVTSAAGTLELTVDGLAPSNAATSWPAGTGSTLTVGARPNRASAGAVVDEVTLLTVSEDAQFLRALVLADRWWSPGPVPVP